MPCDHVTAEVDFGVIGSLVIVRSRTEDFNEAYAHYSVSKLSRENMNNLPFFTR